MTKKYMQYFLSEMQLKYTVLSLIKIDNLLKNNYRLERTKYDSTLCTVGNRQSTVGKLQIED
ncbi:hypothetical protein KsCSTR_37420 [Candidatus Kuenenia stuttgartiensis]|uniref:Uncharacterized protein n=1 Tax=Kuenenia stuttgartiensis TaxID=174633 RepID=Q1Q684_KUEST|nr:hypothetical protein KsCSTR_37420 [Candidatus Kuenenia stuttgartiensis]CAJ73079.1 unknown protein [Candidatus Kuenenia stuttgartiensis]SOH05793.1 hypothetical protein KSMBR1_3316 [Candidatus Kuenenia stuttgartiensis]